jgi:hypothetical protein
MKTKRARSAFASNGRVGLRVVRPSDFAAPNHIRHSLFLGSREKYFWREAVLGFLADGMLLGRVGI